MRMKLTSHVYMDEMSSLCCTYDTCNARRRQMIFRQRFKSVISILKCRLPGECCVGHTHRGREQSTEAKGSSAGMIMADTELSRFSCCLALRRA